MLYTRLTKPYALASAGEHRLDFRRSFRPGFVLPREELFGKERELISRIAAGNRAKEKRAVSDKYTKKKTTIGSGFLASNWFSLYKPITEVKINMKAVGNLVF